MKLKREEIHKIAELVVKNLSAHSLMISKSGTDQLLSKIETVLQRNMDEEAAIEEEVKKLMEQYRSQIASGTIDPQKAYMMIKKQIAKERKFVL